MRAVWSFWTPPFVAHKHEIWCRPLHHLLAWGLSLHAARRHYSDTVLVTDTPGKRLLVDQLGLSFTSVSTELDRLKHVDVDWWALGKLVAYGLQDRPFVHIDTDVFLWKPLPREVADAPVFAQCPEYYHSSDSYDSPRPIEHAFAAEGCELPVEWVWARSREEYRFKEECCGIVGGSNIPFIRHYSKTAVNLILEPQFARAWRRVSDKRVANMIIEQFLLSACIDFHRFHPESLYRGIRVRHLFPSWGACFDPNHAARAGFTHLLGGAKSSPLVGHRIEQRVRTDDPSYFTRCQQVAQCPLVF